MLVLSRDCDAVIRIGPDIKVKVLSIRKQRVKLGVDAPTNVRVWREEVVSKSAPDDAAAQPLIDTSAESSRFSILVVEDDPAHAQLIRKVLADCQLQRVAWAPTGASAMEVLDGDGGSGQAGPIPHLVLMDLNLPDISGLDVLRRIRTNRRLATIPVVILSSEERESKVADCLQAGANAFVRKSAHYPRFRESISRIVNFWRSDCLLPQAGVGLPA